MCIQSQLCGRPEIDISNMGVLALDIYVEIVIVKKKKDVENCIRILKTNAGFDQGKFVKKHNCGEKEDLQKSG